MPRLKTGTAKCCGGILACRRVLDLARVSGRTVESVISLESVQLLFR